MNLEKIKIKPLIETLKLEDISDEIYFSKKYSNYISNSRLGLINPSQDGSPEKFFNGVDDAFSDSLVFGSACHELVLQPESFFICESVDRPTSKAGYIADYVYDKTGEFPSDSKLIEAASKYEYYKTTFNNSKLEALKEKCKDYWKNRYEFESSNVDSRIPIYLDLKNRERLSACLKALDSNNKIQELLHPTGLIQEPMVANEKTILLDVEVQVEDYEPFILKLKSKLDNFSIDCDTNTITVNDLKTTGKMVNVFNEAIYTFHYYREMGMYSYLLSLCASKFYNLENPTIKSNFLVVSTIPQYYTKVVPMTKKLFLKGFREFINLTKLVGYYVATDSRYKHFASI